MEKVHHKNRHQSAGKIGCKIHDKIEECMMCLQTKNGIDAMENKEWAKRIYHWPYFDRTPDWDLLECGCPITEWWSCMCGLRRYARINPPHIMHDSFKQQMAECPLDEKSMMYKFHDLIKKWWPKYEKLILIRPRWRVAILETYVDMGHHIEPRWPGNAMSVVSLIQMEKFARTLLYNAEIKWSFDACYEYANELASGGKRYHPNLTKPETKIGYVYTFLFARLHDLLQHTPLLFDISKPLIQGIVESEEGVIQQTNKHLEGPDIGSLILNNFNKGNKQ